MVKCNQLSPGMIITFQNKFYRVESCVKVTLAKGTPFIKTKLCEISTDKTTEKNFKPDQSVDEVSLTERNLEYLYLEGKDHLFLDFDLLEQVLVPQKVIGDKIHYLKEGTKLSASFYGDHIFAVELPQFLEIMISHIEDEEDAEQGDSHTAILETGARVNVPKFIEAGDVIKVDTKSNEYIQRV